MTDLTVTPMTPAAVATALRILQWQIADVAADLPAGRVTPDTAAELADELDRMAGVLRGVSRDHPCGCGGAQFCRICACPCHC